MSIHWAERQRNTNKLARKIAEYIFTQDNVSAEKLYNLSRLSWITRSCEGEDAKYIKNVKIPALGAIFDKNYDKATSLEKVAEDIEAITQNLISKAEILQHTGFTDFYSAYRGSVPEWVEKNFDLLLPMYKSAFRAKSSKDRRKLVEQTANTPKISITGRSTKPEYFLTPTFFMLDKEIRFPIINGRSVKNLLKSLGVQKQSLPAQYDAMTALYGKHGIVDAADLDQIADIPDFIDSSGKKATKKLLEEKETENSSLLTLKDETDVEAIKRSGTIEKKRTHNQLTNKILRNLSNFTLLEGRENSCMFDVLVKNYDSANDLIIEVKSSTERSNIRMAVGQLYDYWYELKCCDVKYDNPYIAILLPVRPDDKAIQYLDWMKIGLLWFEGDNLHTSSNWLEPIATVS